MISQIKVMLILLFFFISCKKNISSADSNEILIISSKEDSLHSSPTIYSFIHQRNKYLPLEEDYYKVKWVSPDDFTNYLNHPIILALKLNYPKDNTGDKLFDKIFKNKQIGSKLNFIRNFYSDQQTIIGIEADDVIELNEIVKNDKIKIFNEIDDKIFNLMLRKYHKKPNNQELIEKIKKRYGINIFIDHEYETIKDMNDLLWIGRGSPSWGDPYRWILIKNIEKCNTPLNCLNIVQETFNLLDDSAYIEISSHNDIQSYRYSYNNNYFIGGSYKYYEILKNDGKNDTIPIVGGPYISYVYNNTNNSILIVGLVNNPGDDKMIYIKQFESIFRDIKNK